MRPLHFTTNHDRMALDSGECKCNDMPVLTEDENSEGSSFLELCFCAPSPRAIRTIAPLRVSWVVRQWRRWTNVLRIHRTLALAWILLAFFPLAPFQLWRSVDSSSPASQSASPLLALCIYRIKKVRMTTPLSVNEALLLLLAGRRGALTNLQ